MATPNSQDKINRLTVYADMLRNRLQSGIPPRHKDSPETFKQMLEIDLKKTLLMIEKLRG